MSTNICKKILVVSPNWLGDVIMSMPAVLALREKEPTAEITILAKKSVAALWKFHNAINDIVVLEKGNAATFKMAFLLKKRHFDIAYILPNSFRSALIPFLACIPKRRGTAFHARTLMINDRVKFSAEVLSTYHQAKENFFILTGSFDGDMSKTGFNPTVVQNAYTKRDDGDTRKVVGVIPGAARGESKRWKYYAEAMKLMLEKRNDIRFVVCGTAGEATLCEEIANNVGDAAQSIAGKTSLGEFLSVLGSCDIVLCNDSGGMHVASAAGVPVVAMYGVTDPRKTGPIGKNAVVITPAGVKARRDIARNDEEAIKALSSISAECVAESALCHLK